MLKCLPKAFPSSPLHLFGPDSGKNGLDGLPIAFCPLRMEDGAGDFWYSTFQSMGLRVIRISPEEHEGKRLTLRVLPILLGGYLGELNLTSSRIATAGYQSLLDIVTQTCTDPLEIVPGSPEI